MQHGSLKKRKERPCHIQDGLTTNILSSGLGRTEAKQHQKGVTAKVDIGQRPSYAYQPCWEQCRQQGSRTRMAPGGLPRESNGWPGGACLRKPQTSLVTPPCPSLLCSLRRSCCALATSTQTWESAVFGAQCLAAHSLRSYWPEKVLCRPSSSCLLT